MAGCFTGSHHNPVWVDVDDLLAENRRLKQEAEDAFDLPAFIERVERSFFRTNQDTGANDNALAVWNLVREAAGLDVLSHDDLRQRHLETSYSVNSMQEILEFERWMKAYRLRRDFARIKAEYEALQPGEGEL